MNAWNTNLFPSHNVIFIFIYIVIGLLQFGQPSTKEDYVNSEIYLFHYRNLGWKSDNLDSQKCVYTNRPNRC